MSRKLFSVPSLAVAVALFLALPALAGTMPTLNHDFLHKKEGGKLPAVGEFSISDSISPATRSCSGTLIRSRWVLTAAHCVDTAALMTFELREERRAGESRVNPQRRISAKSWYVHKKWNREFFQGNDIALVLLQRSMKNVRPMGLFKRGVEFGLEATLAGYGATGSGEGFSFAAGTKRAGKNVLDIDITPNRKLLAYDFDDDPTRLGYNGPAVDPISGKVVPLEEDFPITLEYLTAPGDSGGPVVIGGQIAGVHSFLDGTFDGLADASFHDIGYSTRVKKWRRWLRRNMRHVNRGSAPRNALVGSFGSPIFDTPPADVFLGAPSSGQYLPLQAAAVPEPGTLGLLSIGGLVLWRRSRRG